MTEPKTSQRAREIEFGASDAFEMGYVWAMTLRGQTMEDSRAVGRTLCSDTFDPIAKEIEEVMEAVGFDSFTTAAAGIAASKLILKAAIDKALNLSRTSTTDDALAERVAIVAWLREQAGDGNGPVQKRNLSFQIAAHNLANAIESGSHLTRGG